MKIVIVLLILVLLSFAVDGSEVLEEQSLVDKILQDGLIVSPELDAAGVRSQLGAPLKTTTENIENKYSDITDHIEALYYKDLTVLVYTVADPEYGWSKVSQVVASGNTYSVPIKIGLHKTDVARLIGEKGHASTVDAWYYFPSEEESHLQLIIKFKDDRVSEVIWSYMP